MGLHNHWTTPSAKTLNTLEPLHLTSKSELVTAPSISLPAFLNTFLPSLSVISSSLSLSSSCSLFKLPLLVPLAGLPPFIPPSELGVTDLEVGLELVWSRWRSVSISSGWDGEASVLVVADRQVMLNSAYCALSRLNTKAFKNWKQMDAISMYFNKYFLIGLIS